MYLELACPGCQASETLSESEAIQRLRAAGLLKREKEPGVEMVLELLKSTAAGWSCAECGRVGLQALPARDDFADEKWGQARPCERCGAPIPAERLELFPNIKLCVACQQGAERGAGAAGEAEYCERCGSILQLRQSRAGITRYVMECPACRR